MKPPDESPAQEEFSEDVLPDLGLVACAQLTLGADLRLSPFQVTMVRDSVLSLFPSSALPPWYFRQLYQRGSVTYELAASIAASNRSDPSRPYNVFFRIDRLGDVGFDAPLVSDLLHILSPQSELEIHCSATFIREASDGIPRDALPYDVYRDESGARVLESYVLGLYDGSDERIGTTEVKRFGDHGHLYLVSFSQSGALRADLFTGLMDRAASLLHQVYSEREWDR